MYNRLLFYIIYWDMAGKQTLHNNIARDVKETELDYYNWNWPTSFVPIEDIADPTDQSRQKFGKNKKEKYWDVLYQTPWVPPVQKELITILWDWVAHTVPIEEASEYKVASTFEKERLLSEKNDSKNHKKLSDHIQKIAEDIMLTMAPTKLDTAISPFFSYLRTPKVTKHNKTRKNPIAKNAKRRNQKTKSYRPRQWTEDEMNKYYKKIQYYKVKNRVPL